MAEKVTIGNCELWHGDCREVLPMLPVVDCIITDPPYFRVKGDYWDNEWDNASEFLGWMRGIIGLLADRMKPNASAYVFASPQMAGRVEAVAWERLNVLGSIVWRKGGRGRQTTGWHQKAEKEALRSFLFETERIIFAEHYNSDNFARGEASYAQKCDELRGFVFEPLRAYLADALRAAGWTVARLNAAMGFAAGGMASHYFSRSQWALPTAEHYRSMRELVGADFLRREYEDLRREYEDLRRHFKLTERDQWSDVWDFDPVAAYPGKHPCEKPLPLLAHMLNASTKPGALVLDAFMGSGATGDACVQMGRRFIGIERDPEHFASACRRIEQAYAQPRLFEDAKVGAGETAVQGDMLLPANAELEGTCKKCGGAMKPGKAISQTWTGIPDFPGDKHCVTLSPGGSGKLIDCVKCEECGWSMTSNAMYTADSAG